MHENRKEQESVISPWLILAGFRAKQRHDEYSGQHARKSERAGWRSQGRSVHPSSYVRTGWSLERATILAVATCIFNFCRMHYSPCFYISYNSAGFLNWQSLNVARYLSILSNKQKSLSLRRPILHQFPLLLYFVYFFVVRITANCASWNLLAFQRSIQIYTINPLATFRERNVFIQTCLLSYNINKRMFPSHLLSYRIILSFFLLSKDFERINKRIDLVVVVVVVVLLQRTISPRVVREK